MANRTEDLPLLNLFWDLNVYNITNSASLAEMQDEKELSLKPKSYTECRKSMD